MFSTGTSQWEFGGEDQGGQVITGQGGKLTSLPSRLAASVTPASSADGRPDDARLPGPPCTRRSTYAPLGVPAVYASATFEDGILFCTLGPRADARGGQSASHVDDGASLVGGGASIVGGGQSFVGNGASLVGDDASGAGNGALVVGGGA